MNSYRGLNNEQVAESRTKYGSNVLTPAKRESWVRLFLGKFNDPLIKILLVAATVSIAIGFFSEESSIIESVGIIVAIFLATFISFINEYKAGKEFDILNKLSDTTLVKVIREDENGNSVVMQIPKTEVVVGDYVIVASGDEIPADGDICECLELKVNESSLNGESKPSTKLAEKVDKFDTAYSPNKLYRGTTVSEGDAVYKVVAVGDATEIGKTARQASEITGVATPLSRQLEKLGKMIGKVGIWIAVLTFVILCARDIILGQFTAPFWSAHNITLLIKFFMIAVTLIVMAVPEGLPMSIALSLAYSMRKMTAQHTLVRKMHACETMGATTVICTDKTGTLTLNKMQVHFCSAEVDSLFATGISCNSTAFLNGDKVIGNPTEGALLLYLQSKGFDYSAIRNEVAQIHRLPFSSQTKYMATLCAVPPETMSTWKGYTIGGQADGSVKDVNGVKRYFLFLKGAPEIVVSKCGICNLDKGRGDAFSEKDELAKIAEYQQKGMRSLSFAHYELSAEDVSRLENENAGKSASSSALITSLLDNADFVYDGFVSIQDPVREDVPKAMAECVKAGIGVKIVTGDTSLTAVEIARQSGLWKPEDIIGINSITGPEFEKLSDGEAVERIKEIKVMSRARPSDKMRLVKLLQKSGEIVAVTGDGTNDAPALNYADVGLAMGSGTAVAKESSDIILLNDSFTSVVSAVQWGRSIYINIQKFIYFQLTVNVAALLIALVGPMVGVEMPLTVTQILWVNLIMDTLAAIALATEPSDPEVMNRKPRKIEDSIITKKMWRGIIGYGVGFFIAALVFLLADKYFGFLCDFGADLFDGNESGLTFPQLTLFFTLFVYMLFWNLFNARALGTSHSAFHGLAKNRSFITIATVIFILQIVIIMIGGRAFRTVPIPFWTVLVVFALTSIVVWVGEISRIHRR